MRTEKQILARIKSMAKAGGDKEPCKLGRYCWRCLIACVQTEFQEKDDESPRLLDCFKSIMNGGSYLPGDKPYWSLRDKILNLEGDTPIVHTKKTVLELLGKVQV